jgi:transglutaminase-like putative cysteine protease
MRGLHHGFVAVVAAVLVALPAFAVPGPVLHERLPPDPQEDLVFAASLDGDLPAALETSSGIVSAPDPRRPVAPDEPPYTPDGASTVIRPRFAPDLDTRRPDVLGYDDPFSPSTAPFKRLIALDAVDPRYELYVHDPELVPLKLRPGGPDASEDAFFADLIVDVARGRRVRVPSVGPGARVLRARLGSGDDAIGFRLFRDGADNWFLEADRPGRARLVMELSIARAAFGGEFPNVTWQRLPNVPPLPPNVRRAAQIVTERIGVSRAQPPREVVTKLVDYFRSFKDSAEPPTRSGDIYLDLALSKKGVCRHRAFAFTVTALALGIPTRMVLNEAHAWVEVHDGALYRRIDLGGAGRSMRETAASSVVHEPPSDPFAWPPNAERGTDLAERARRDGARTASGGAASQSGSLAGQPNGASGGDTRGGASRGDDGPGGRSGGDANRSSATGTAATGAPLRGANADGKDGAEDPRDERPSSRLTLALSARDARRGSPLRVNGVVEADGRPCANLPVEVVLRRARGAEERVLGSLATDTRGVYEGALVLPSSLPLDDYDVFARTPGDARCGKGVGP